MSWSRRQVLGALAGTAMAPLVTPLLGCGASGGGVRRAARQAPRSAADVRAQLGSIVAELGERFEGASALAVRRRRGTGWVSAGERILDEDARSWVVLGVGAPGSVRVERVVAGFDEAELERAALGLAEDASAAGMKAPGKTGEAAPVGAPPVDKATRCEVDPAGAGPERWQEALDRLWTQGRRIGGSRIVHRSSYLGVDDVQAWYLAGGIDLGQRVVRARAGLLLLAEARHGLTGERAEVSGAGGLELAVLETAALDETAERVLALSTPRPIPTGEAELLLAPELVAALVLGCVAPALCADRWLSGEARAATLVDRAVAAGGVTLRDDPGAPGAFGGYYFDDEGAAAGPTALIEAGVLRAPLTCAASAAALGAARTGNGRRAGGGAVAPWPSHLRLEPGPHPMRELIAGVDAGYLLEGARAVRSDPGSWKFSLRAARAHELRGGKPTGRLFAEVEVRGEVPALLGAVAGLSAEVAQHAGDDPELPTSASAPFALTRGVVVGGGWRAA